MLLFFVYKSDHSDPGPLTCETQKKAQNEKLNFSGKVIIVTGDKGFI